MFYGIDFHVNKFTYHKISYSKKGVERQTRTMYLNELHNKFIPMLTKNDHVCIEALSGTFAFITLIKKYVKSVAVINPYDFKQITCSSKKNDKIDAKKIANAFKYHIEADDPNDGFPTVYIPNSKVRELRSLFTTYNLLKKEKVQLKNRIHSILKENLIVLDRTNLFRSLDDEMITSFKINDIYKIQIKVLYDSIEIIDKQQEEIKNIIIKKGIDQFEKEIKLLIGINGVSIFIACAIMADTADIYRFKNANHFTSYMRSAPRLNASNDTIHNGKIDKKGRKLTYSLLLQGLQHIRKSNDNFSNFYDKKIQNKSKCKVRSALVRKTLVAIYYMLKNNEEYKFIGKNYSRKLKELEKIKNN